MPARKDILILGRGIAGASLAEACRKRGLGFHVYDRKRPGNASMVAAGLVNPVVLRRNVPCWRAAELMPLATSFLGAWQERLGIRCWHGRRLEQVFATARDADRWRQAALDPVLARFLVLPPEQGVDMAKLNIPHGHGTVKAAWLDVPKLLDAQRTELLREDCLTEVDITGGDIHQTPDGVRIGEVEGRWLVRCEGPFADLRGLAPVKGETLTVRIPGLALSHIVHRGVFLLPLGDELYRAGSTFRWDAIWESPSREARTWLLDRLALLTDLPVEVINQQAGVRPAAKDRRPLLGAAGEHEAVLNGLGARGVMLAPWCAQHLLAHLLDGAPLDAEVRADRF